MSYRLMLVMFITLVLTVTGCGDGEETESPMSTIAGWSKTASLKSFDSSVRESLQFDFTQGNGAGAYTIQFSITDYNTVIGPVNPVAVLDWSVAGNSVRRIVTVSDGLSITGFGSAVKLTIYDENPNTQGALTGHAQSYHVGITVAPGTRADVMQPPTYIPWILSAIDGMYHLGAMDLAAGTPITVLIPPQVGVISVECMFAPGAAGAWNAYDLQAFISDSTGTGYIKSYNPTNFDFVPVPPMSKQILFIYNGVHSGTGSISFGIDG